MGAGTLIELIARGQQDTYIIGNPNFSYFKSVYRRHTNFSIEPIRQIFTESPEFGKRVTCIIDKKADLLNDIILEIELPAISPTIQFLSWVNGIGNFMLDWVEVQFGGEPIDRIQADILDAWMELTTKPGVKTQLYSMIAKNTTSSPGQNATSLKLLVPLPFWFCRSIERALPLISMQYTDVKIVVQFKTFDQCWFKATTTLPTTIPSIGKANLICNYIYLDVFERTKFAKQEIHEYLIEQFQQTSLYQIPENILNLNARIFFNHPVKELIWMYRSSFALSINDYYNYSNYDELYTQDGITNMKTLGVPIDQVQIRYNGNDRFELLPETFFRLYQPYRYHSSGTTNNIYVYSFAIDPENMQPSGTCNFSKIDNATLNITFVPNIKDGILSIYATNYNILRIKSGMAGVMFSS